MRSLVYLINSHPHQAGHRAARPVSAQPARERTARRHLLGLRRG